MPLHDFFCRNCGYERLDKFFPTYASAEVPTICVECGNEMDKKIPLFQFKSFVPFTTRNIRSDGKPVHITSRNQLQRVMKENGVVPHPFNDSLEARVDHRELATVVKENQKKFPARYKKLKKEVQALRGEEVKPMSDRATRTNFEQRTI